MPSFRTWLEAQGTGQAGWPQLTLSVRPKTDRWMASPPLVKDPNLKTYSCNTCLHYFQYPKGLGQPFSCPRCASPDIKPFDIRTQRV